MADWEVLPKEDPVAQADQPPVIVARRKRLVAAFVIAAVSDFLSVWLEFVPPLQWAIDIATAVALFLILGRQWVILPALIAEAIPGLGVFPFWLLVVGSIALWGTIKKPSFKRPPPS